MTLYILASLAAHNRICIFTSNGINSFLLPIVTHIFSHFRLALQTKQHLLRPGKDK